GPWRSPDIRDRLSQRVPRPADIQPHVQAPLRPYPAGGAQRTGPGKGQPLVIDAVKPLYPDGLMSGRDARGSGLASRDPGEIGSLMVEVPVSVGCPTRAASMLSRARWVVVLALAIASAGLVAMARAEDQSLVARGLYMAHLADCMACHTRPGGTPY